MKQDIAKMKKEIMNESALVAVPAQNFPAGQIVPDDSPGECLGTDWVSSQDISKNWIQLCQAMSDLVSDGKAKPGDIVNTSKNQVLGGVGNPALVVIARIHKTWTIEKKVDGRWGFLRTEAIQPGKEKLPWDFTENGESLRRNYTINAYCFLEDELLDSTATPKIVSFKRSSIKAGYDLAALTLKLKENKLPLWGYSFRLESEKEDNGKDKYFVYKISIGSKIPEQKRTLPNNWFHILENVELAADPEDVKQIPHAADPGSAPRIEI